MLRIAIAGVTGAVGREILNILSEYDFPIKDLHALASSQSIGQVVEYKDKKLRVQALEDFDFTKVDVCLSSVSADVCKKFAPKITGQGCLIIDNSSAWRSDISVPLIVPEVNPDAVKDFRKKNIIANPNCSTIQLAVALKPLHDAFSVKRVIVSTYQSVSGAGKAGMDELFEQTRSIFSANTPKSKNFPKRIAFNLFPHIDDFMVDGSTKEEWKMMTEIKKILDPNIKLFATCVRVPVFIGHSEAVNIECDRPIDPQEAKEILRQSPGIIVPDFESPENYMTPHESAGEDATYVSRIREDPTVENGLSFWCVADNLRKGAALNVVQILDLLLKRNLIGLTSTNE